MAVSITLFSNDEALAKSCREVLAEVPDIDWVLAARAVGAVAPSDDICIWDFTPGVTAIPQDLDPATLRKHLFVLQRRHLAALQSVLGTSDLNVLLKPVTRATLRAFLSGAVQQRCAQNEGAGVRMKVLRVERDEMLQVLIQANLKLQEYDQERNNFLARSVHDFRAPLTAITGYCGLLLEEELGPVTPEQREVLERMQHSARRLSRLSNAMFQLSIPHNVEQKLNLEKADIRDCIDQALHEVALSLEDKRIAVAVDIEAPAEELLFEKSQIEQTLVNLLDNACKFTPRDGTIEIRGYPFFWERRNGQAASLDPSLDRRGNQVKALNSFRVDIRDSGPGIPPAHVERIFEEYTSYSGGQDRSGGGLGLAICRMILHRHRGRVWAESSPAGAVFSFVLPCRENGNGTPGGVRWLDKRYVAGPVEN